MADWNWVPSGSMNPTILEGDLVFVDKVAYDLRIPLTLHRIAKWDDPERGDIVICFSPEDDVRLVKRVIGLPGDTLEMKRNVLHINEQPIRYSRSEPACAEQLPDKLRKHAVVATEELDGHAHSVMSVPSLRAMRDFGPVVVPQGSYFMMGDNRDCSKDSRHFGFVEREAIVGKARGIIVSFDITDDYLPRLKRFLSTIE